MLLEPDGHLLINGCFNRMMNQIFTKEMVGNQHFHPFRTCCLGYQAEPHFDLPMFLNFVRPKDTSLSRRGDFVPCFCFGLACHGEPGNWKKLKNEL